TQRGSTGAADTTRTVQRTSAFRERKPSGKEQCECPDRGQTGDRSREPGSRREPRRRAEHRGVALHPVFRYRGPERGRGRVPRKTQAELQRPVTRTGSILLALYSTERGKP